MKFPEYKKCHRSHQNTNESRGLQYKSSRAAANGHAISALIRKINLGEESHLIYKKLAELYEKEYKYDKALECINHAISLYPNNIELREIAIEIALEQGYSILVEKYCNELLNMNPLNITARAALYTVYINRAEFSEALRIATEMVRLDPSSADNHYCRAFALNELGNINATIYELSQLLETCNDEEMEAEARRAIDYLDAIQIRQVLALAMEDALFRMKLIRNPEDALSERGYFISDFGIALLNRLQYDAISDLHSGRRHKYEN